MNIANIHESAKDFHLLQTTGRTQTAAITLKQGEATSEDLSRHPRSEQTVVVLEGEIIADVGNEHEVLHEGQSLIIPPGVAHRLHNDAKSAAFAFTIYSPPAYENE